MRHHTTTTAGVIALACGICGTVQAQENTQSYLNEHLPAPSDALELKVGTGYTQGFGNLAPGRGLNDVAGAGLGFSADVDYRIDHRWSLGVEGQYQEFQAEDNSSSRGLAANLGATYHFDPVLRGDPWFRFGTGYRWLWENEPMGTQGVDILRHGFDLVTAKVGYDVRVSEDIALAPVVGADLNMFLWQDADGNNTTLSSAQVAMFVYAGLQARFDLGGARTPKAVAKRPERMGVASPQPQTPIAPPPVEETRAVSPSISVSRDVLRECMTNLDNIDSAPKFDFDKSDLLPADYDVLRRIAECFTTGPMKGKGLHLVGHADPRGTIPYNDALGASRARGVATYLETLGVEAGRIEQSSRGKRDARGTDEATWAIDRRVDIVEGR